MPKNKKNKKNTKPKPSIANTVPIKPTNNQKRETKKYLESRKGVISSNSEKQIYALATLKGFGINRMLVAKPGRFDGCAERAILNSISVSQLGKDVLTIEVFNAFPCRDCCERLMQVAKQKNTNIKVSVTGAKGVYRAECSTATNVEIPDSATEFYFVFMSDGTVIREKDRIV